MFHKPARGWLRLRLPGLARFHWHRFNRPCSSDYEFSNWYECRCGEMREGI